MRIKEKIFKVDYINIINIIHNLEVIYRYKEKYDEMIVYYERALRIKEKIFEVDYINNTDIINNLGLIYDL